MGSYQVIINERSHIIEVKLFNFGDLVRGAESIKEV
jgi:hypothetical protein